MAQTQQKSQNYRTYKYGLFDCTENCLRCLYVSCCSCCAIADLSLVIDPCCVENKVMRWWLLMLLNSIAVLVSFAIDYYYVQGVGMFFKIVVQIVFINILINSSNNIADKIGYPREESDCGCCHTYLCCFWCKFCQIANQLDIDPYTGNQCKGTVELCTEINEIALFKNCLCEVTNPAPEDFNQQQPAAIYVNAAPNYNQQQFAGSYVHAAPNHNQQQPEGSYVHTAPNHNQQQSEGSNVHTEPNYNQQQPDATPVCPSAPEVTV